MTVPGENYLLAAQKLGNKFLTDAFDDRKGVLFSSLSAIAEKKEKEKTDPHNLVERAMAGDEGAAALAGGRSNALQEKSRKEEEAKRSLTDFMLRQGLTSAAQALNDYIGDLKEMAQALRDKINEIDRRIDENAGKIKEYKRSHDSALESLGELDQDGALARGADGKLKNKDAQRALEEYIRRTGHTPGSDGLAAEAIRNQIAFERTQVIPGLEGENAELTRQRKEVRNVLDEVQAEAERLTRERDKIENSGLSDAEKAEAIKKLWEGAQNREVLSKARALNSDNSLVKEEIKAADKVFEKRENNLADVATTFDDLNALYAKSAATTAPKV